MSTVTPPLPLIIEMDKPGGSGGLDCCRYVAAVMYECHGGKDRAPQIDRGEVKGKHSAAAMAHGDAQIVLVERMEFTGPKVKPYIVRPETLVELNSYLVSAHELVAPFGSGR